MNREGKGTGATGLASTRLLSPTLAIAASGYALNRYGKISVTHLNFIKEIAVAETSV
jgi:hypothetical protein